MAVTRLKRKDRRNKARAANRLSRMKQLTKRPVIKKLDSTAETTAAAASTASESTSEEE